jgi:hypothetical protein
MNAGGRDHQPAPAGWGAERQLARLEGRRLLAQPLAWLSFIPFVLWARAIDTLHNPEDVHFLLVGYGLVFPGFVLFALVVLGVLRSRSAGSDEILDVLPVGRDRRSVAHGLSALAAGLAGALAVGAGYLALRPEPLVGSMKDVLPVGIEVPRPGLAQLLQGPLALIVWCALGVALARWLPSPLVVLALVVPAAAQFTLAGVWNGAPVSVVNWLLPLANGMVAGEWVGCGTDDVRCDLQLQGFDRVTPWWHLGYLVALVVVFVAVAVLRDRRDRTVWLTLAGAVAAAVAFGVVQGAVYQPFVPAAA